MKKFLAMLVFFFVALGLLEVSLRLVGQWRKNPASLAKSKVQLESAGRKKLRLLFVGDSVTEGVGANTNFAHLIEQKIPQSEVFNFALRGATSHYIVNQMHSWLKQIRPDLVVAMMGHNDEVHLPNSGTSLSWLGQLKTVKFFQNLLLPLLEKNNAENWMFIVQRYQNPPNVVAKKNRNLHVSSSTQKLFQQMQLAQAGHNIVLIKKLLLSAKEDLVNLPFTHIIENCWRLKSDADIQQQLRWLLNKSLPHHLEYWNLLVLNSENATDFIQKLSHVFKYDPKSLPDPQWLAQGLIKLHDYTKAQEFLETNWQKYPELKITYIDFLLEARKFIEVKKVLQPFSTQKMTEENVEFAKLIEGRILHLQGQLANAKAIYTQIKSSQADQKRSFFLAQLYSDLGEAQEALTWSKKLAQQQPTFWFAHLLVGESWERLGQFNEAHLAYQQALKLNPHARHLYLTLAQFYQKQKNDWGYSKALWLGSEECPEARLDFLNLLHDYYKKIGDEKNLQKVVLLISSPQNRSMTETKDNFRKLADITNKENIPLLIISYPKENALIYRQMLEGYTPEIVDLSDPFKKWSEQYSYTELFNDTCCGNWGHLTDKGHELVANFLVPKILELRLPKQVAANNAF